MEAGNPKVIIVLPWLLMSERR